MPARNNALKDQLSRSTEIRISVTGRKSGRTISIPVWFVLEEDQLYLLPVQGSGTQWYKNAVKNPTIRIGVRGAEAEFKVAPVTDAKQVKSVVEKFRQVRGRRREEVLFKVRCGGRGRDALINDHAESSCLGVTHERLPSRKDTRSDVRCPHLFLL